MADHAEIDQAVQRLRAGELVAFPTETVYGLGADATSPLAVAKIFAAKGRPADHPLIVHLPMAAQASLWVREWPATAQRLAERFWPGPLTMVLPRAPQVLDAVTGGQDTVAIRVPAHPVARALLAAFGSGIAAPSANRYGRVSPTRAAHVREEFGAALVQVLDGGDCDFGLESTIVAGVDGGWQLLRPGSISRADVESVTGTLLGAGSPLARVPGSAKSHYAPTTPIELVTSGDLAARLRALQPAAPLAVLAMRVPPEGFAGGNWRTMPADAAGYGHELYAALRAADSHGAVLLLIERVPATPAWDAVRDRLERAAARDLPATT